MSPIGLTVPPGRERTVVGRRVLVTVAGALLAGLAVGTRPGFHPQPAPGVVGGVLAFAALVAGTPWALRTIDRATWRWAAAFGAVLAGAAVVGVIVRGRTTPGGPVMVGWLGVRWVGLGWLAGCLFAAAAHAADRSGPPVSTRPGAPGYQRSGGVRQFIAGLPESLTSSDRTIRSRSVLVIGALLVLARVPYLVIWWPGILFADTHRSYVEVRGIGAWTSYEPVGHSLMVGLAQWLGTALGLGDSGGVAIAAVAQILAMSAAFTMLLLLLASCGVPRLLWFGSLGWLVLLPLFGLSSITIMKDESFSVALVFFMAALVEVVFGTRSPRPRWPWVVLAVSGMFLIGTRNNGSYVVLVTLPILLIALRRLRRPLLGVLVALVVGYIGYIGPLYSALDVTAGPKAEAYSVPIQQMARIAKVHGSQLSARDRQFLTMAFEDPPEVLSGHYVPELSDPMKSFGARDAWQTHPTTQMLSGWLRLVTEYPGTAIDATLANTVGYWDPTSASYDGVVLAGTTALPIRTSGVPTTGFRGWLMTSGVVPVKNYWSGQSDSGYLTIPVLGSAMSPGFVSWVWIGSLVLVVRRRRWPALVLFVAPAMLALTVLAGPVSGGQRYALPFFMTLPLAVAIGFLASARTQTQR